MLDTAEQIDFLEAQRSPDTAPDITTLAFSSRILLGILREIRKAHPSQRCVIDLQFSNPLRILDSAADYVDVRFLAQGRPVLSQYLVVANNTASKINVGLNESVVINAASTFSNGIPVNAGTVFQIPVEIETIQIRVDAAGPGLGIVCQNGNSGTGLPVNGTIQIYGWTLPLSDKDDTE